VRSGPTGVSLAADQTTTLARFWSRALKSVNSHGNPQRVPNPSRALAPAG
jgi:hypothetical protein